MYTVVLVDDEIWSLEGLAVSLDWEGRGFRVVGKYTDSMEALAFIEKTEPALLVTDIRMPDLTGIELIEKIREKKLETAVVIVSGYADFAYAKEAVRQGAYDYFLKPVDTAEADALLVRLKADLDRRRYAEDKALLWRLLYENGGEERLEAFSDGSSLQAMAVCGTESRIPYAALLPRTAGNALELRITENRRIFLYEIKAQEEREEWGKRLSALVGKGCAGISAVGEKKEWRRLLQEAILAASGRFIGSTGVAFYTEVTDPYYVICGKKIGRCIENGQYEKACSLLDEAAQLIKSDKMGVFYAARLWNQIALLLHESRHEEKKLEVEFLDFYQLLQRFETVETLIRYMKVELAQFLLGRTEKEETRREYNENFLHLLQYVDNCYTEKLSLSELAERFFLNMSYCSELFKKVTGLTFSDYVTNKRMERAAQLLVQEGRKVREAAELTGYADTFYFTKVFKKFYGVTPVYFAEHGKKER